MRSALTPEQQAQLRSVDDELQRQWAVIGEADVFADGQPRTHWWWYLGEGPQVREEAASLSAPTP
jgi:hypothetical protein